MAFDEQPLDSTIDFAHIGENKVTVIIGKGQMVYWKGSNVTVITKDNDGQEQYRRLSEMPDGQGKVEEGIKLYITRGQVKEG